MDIIAGSELESDCMQSCYMFLILRDISPD